MPQEKSQVGRTPFHDAAWNQRFRRRVLSWFRRHARDLPWRRSRDPYEIWISEIMLQQTQVATVIPYFERFLTTFPNLKALAKASEEQVLRHWEGLGYYRRARQLHRAAQVIVAEHGGRFPDDPEVIKQLPGIGRYTAGAISSIAFDARQPILEANTIRLFSRLLSFRGDAQSREGRDQLWGFAEEILPVKQVGDFNQGLMELGATVCVPRDPDCSRCPLATLCPTQAHGWQGEIPAPRRRIKYESVDEACIVVRHRGAVLLRHCGDGERWAGLWDFPRFSLVPERKMSTKTEVTDDLARRVEQLTGVTIAHGRPLTTIKHGVTKFRITLACYEYKYRRGRLNDVTQRWVNPNQLHDYPLSVTGRKIAKLLT